MKTAKSIEYSGSFINDEFTGYIRLYLNRTKFAEITARSISVQELHCVGAAIMYDWMLNAPYKVPIHVRYAVCDCEEISNLSHDVLTFGEITPIRYFTVPAHYNDYVRAFQECNIKMYNYLYTEHNRYPKS